MSDPTRFDPLIRLLDLNDDKRMPLFFHELRKVNRTAQNTIQTHGISRTGSRFQNCDLDLLYKI